MHPISYVRPQPEKAGLFWNGEVSGGAKAPPISLAIIDYTHTGEDTRNANWPELMTDPTVYNGVTRNNTFLSMTLPEIIRSTSEWLKESILGIHCEATVLEISSRLFELQQRIIYNLSCVPVPFKYHRAVHITAVKITENSTKYALLVLPNE